MKKTTLIALTLFIALAANSQRVQFGVKAGVNISDIKDDPAPNNTNPETGFHVGGLAHFHINRSFAIQPELTFSSQGARYTLPNYNGEVKQYYINLPVLAQYMTRGGLRLQTGPQLGFLTSAKFEPTGGGAETDLKNITRDINFEWSFGAGYLTSSGLGLDARYNLGIANLYQQGTPQAKSRVWQFGVFYQFRR